MFEIIFFLMATVCQFKKLHTLLCVYLNIDQHRIISHEKLISVLSLVFHKLKKKTKSNATPFISD